MASNSEDGRTSPKDRIRELETLNGQLEERLKKLMEKAQDSLGKSTAKVNELSEQNKALQQKVDILLKTRGTRKTAGALNSPSVEEDATSVSATASDPQEVEKLRTEVKNLKLQIQEYVEDSKPISQENADLKSKISLSEEDLNREKYQVTNLQNDLEISRDLVKQLEKKLDEESKSKAEIEKMLQAEKVRAREALASMENAKKVSFEAATQLNKSKMAPLISPLKDSVEPANLGVESSISGDGSAEMKTQLSNLELQLAELKQREWLALQNEEHLKVEVSDLKTKLKEMEVEHQSLFSEKHTAFEAEITQIKSEHAAVCRIRGLEFKFPMYLLYNVGLEII
jgi:DNA repair exonuclease SbcCD ATPase subunit